MKLFLIVILLSGAHCNNIWCPVKLTATEYGHLTIKCSYDEFFESRPKYWCKGRRFKNCRILQDTHSYKNNDRISILDDKRKSTFYVTMNDLREDDNGTYWCGISLIFTDIYCQVDIVIQKDPKINPNVGQTTVKVSAVTKSSAYTTEIYNKTGYGSTWKISSAQNITIISVGLLLLLFCLATAVITWRLKSKQVKQNLRNNEQPPGEEGEVNYAQVTECAKKGKPELDSIYANINTIAAEQHLPYNNSIDYAAIKCQ